MRRAVLTVCGICGAFDNAGGLEINRDRVKTATDTMVHRGPDDEGIYISPDRSVGLGIRRLSIVDLEGGRQPMSNLCCPRRDRADSSDEEHGAIWTVVNGEIYNHESLRQVLEARGHVYATRCDAESIVHGYEEWGEDVVEHLRGMFGFAIYDSQPRDGGPKLFLARDRLGIKPLYYSERNGRLIFGSEIKAVLAWPGVPREVDHLALSHYLTLSATPAPLTMFRDIRKLPPGCTLTRTADGRSKVRRYWDPVAEGNPACDASEPEIVERLREHLRESVKLRMMSDVPFGVFLSGGVDSSLNVALMSELMSRPVDTFSVAIRDDPASDELAEARRAAEQFGTNHHEVVISDRDFIEYLPDMVHHQDEPLADPVCVPLYFVSKLARDNGTKVIQVGEGADELFAGYGLYATMADFHRRMYSRFAALPRWVKRPVAALASRAVSTSRAEYLRRATAGQELFWSGASVFTAAQKDRMLRSQDGFSPNDTYGEVLAPMYSRIDSQNKRGSFLSRTILIELQHRLPELLLMRVDKMTMATSVEARVPYLDHELVEFALSIPTTLKYRRGRTKHILKEAARGILPDDIIDRPKTGFCGGARNMISGPVAEHACQIILGSQWLQTIVEKEPLQALLADVRRGRADNTAAVWALMNLAMWHRRMIEGVSQT